jgi:methionine sulfoxide reductase heme-binding subunit
MSHTYRAVSWNPQKRRYDAVLAAAVAGVLALVAAGSALLHPDATGETLALRATGVTGMLLLHVILTVGPLCRLDTRFLPLLYNRRHMGVTMCLLALVHGGLAIVQFHSEGDVSPIVSLLSTSNGWTTVDAFPFQMAGAAALGILVVMGATSHDFWLRTLTAPVWKALHMGVYLAYALVLGHVAFGVLQSERSPWFVALVALGAATVFGLHAVAGRVEALRDRDHAATQADGLVDVCAVERIPERRAFVACVAGERVAIFRYDGRLSAISNVCQHQNGPLGEGRIVRGCVVCPWHGYEYEPATGASPPPFTERVPTFRVAVSRGRVLVDPRPLPPGTYVEPARCP